MSNVIRAKVDGIENAYILTSCVAGHTDRGYRRVLAAVSFLYDAGAVAAEWEPQYGPIQCWEKADPQNTDDPRWYAYKIEKHYFYPYVYVRGLQWSQLAVETERLHDKYLAGDAEGIFAVLRRWAEGHSTEIYKDTSDDDESESGCTDER